MKAYGIMLSDELLFKW